MSDFGGGFALFALVPFLLSIAAVVGIVIAVVIGLRALVSIDRSLQTLAEQGVARGKGPFGPPPTA